MKALTIWQPWASLIIIGAKPYEFRRWDFRTRDRSLVGQRIVIHAGARPMHHAEIAGIVQQVLAGASGLDRNKTLRLLGRLVRGGAIVRAPKNGRRLRLTELVLPLACGLGTAILGEPRRVTDLFPDSDRLDQHMWAWPLTEIQPWDEPVPCRGMQGFWTWPFKPAPAVWSPASDPPEAA